MNREQRLVLLGRMASLTHGEGENVTASSFLPLPGHALALRPEIVIVRGGRGAGKSALFGLINELGTKVPGFFGDSRIPEANWVDAFSQKLSHPEVGTLDELASSVSDAALRAFWLAHLVDCVAEGPQVPEGFRQNVTALRTQPKKWIAWAQEHVGELSAALDRIEVGLEGKYLFATYDHLDRIGQHERQIRSRYVATLLSMWLSLSNRYRKLRAKIFLRDDLFDAAEHAFPDASKLRPRSVSLEWSVEDLYRAAIRNLVAEANAGDDVHQWLVGIPRFELQERSGYGFFPGPMPEAVQRSFATQLAGELMGSGAKKGYTYRWIPNRLQDARRRIVPRSMLNLLGFASERASTKPLSSGRRLMLPTDLAGALEQVSTERAKEVAEEYRPVKRMENLRGLLVLLDRDEVVERLGKPVPGEEPGLPSNGEIVFDELVALGVLSVRDTGRIDVPDIYRYGYGIKRKGGVARPK